MNIEQLKEFPDEILEKELARRNQLRNAGLCSYCMKRLDTKYQKSETPCAKHETYENEDTGKVIPRQIRVKRRF